MENILSTHVPLKQHIIVIPRKDKLKKKKKEKQTAVLLKTVTSMDTCQNEIFNSIRLHVEVQ